MSFLYRKNVGIVVFRHDLKVLVCARADKKDFKWQFPQGGIEEDEDIVEAAKRELFEETGITSVELIAKLPHSLKYDFPKALFYKDKRFRGQEQQWVLFYFFGNDSEIDFFKNPKEIEFKAFEWVEPDEAPKRIVKFKKDVYLQVIDNFKPLIVKRG